MRLPPSLTGAIRFVRDVLRTHRTLTVLLLALFVAGASGSFLRGDILGTASTRFGGPQGSDDDELRACSGMHGPFEDMETIAEVQDEYVSMMSSIFMEHETVLRTPSLWRCGAGKKAEPPIAQLTDVASRLPGWHVIPEIDGPAFPRPVGFSKFSSVVGELQRAYECKLVELQDRAIAEISRNKDRAPGNFCCTPQGCVPDDGTTICSSGSVSDSLCDNMCPVLFTTADLAMRLPRFDEAINTERQRSRNAVERSLYALRSADLNYELARELTCYLRASLDLRNELNLMADAVSCLPKIWNAVTSIHDKKEP